MLKRLLWAGAWRALRAAAAIQWALLSRTPANPPKARILLIYDFSNQPISVGDVLVCHEAGLVLRERFNVELIDIAFLYDPHLERHRDRALAYIDSSNILSTLGSVLQAAQVNPHLGSVMLFDSRERLEAFVTRQLGEYHVWPPLSYYASGQYFYYHVLNELLYEHFERFGSIPALRSRPSVRQWAEQFVAAHVAPALPVSIQLRNNPHNPARNSDYECWLAFFRQCAAARENFKFIVICDLHELDERLNGLPNVVVAKRHCTNLEQDLALIEVSRFHMGASSGPSTMAMFSGKPYAVFGWKTTEYRYRDLKREGICRRFFFAHDYQRLIVEKETPALLAAEFELLKNFVHPMTETRGQAVPP